jgi:hypothetical protein
MLKESTISEIKRQIEEQGFALIPEFYSPSFLRELDDEATLMEQHYTPENIDNHSVYLSDRTDTRVSNAMMISQSGRSMLPVVPAAVESVGGTTTLMHIVQFLTDHNQIIGSLTGKDVAANSRSMLNWQRYSAGSKPVAAHYDGEYLKYNKKSPTEFELIEGVLPRYVLVLTVHNENTDGPQGTVLTDLETGKTYDELPSKEGNLLIFDNIRFRHAVPTLPKPRRMLGLRNWDHKGVHYVRTPDLANELSQYQVMPDGGFHSVLDLMKVPLVQREFSAINRQIDFMIGGEWEKMRAQQKSEGAVF